MEGTEQLVPYSAGTRAPKLEAPANACDSHMHIFDPRFPPSSHWSRGAPDAPVETYRLLQKRIGTTRAVVVNPSTYGTDNTCTLDAVAKIGASARAVAVVGMDVSNAELKQLAGLGVCGIRINFVSPQSWGTTTVEMLESLAQRVNELGWHVQVFTLADQIVEMEDALQRLPTPLVIDHLGRLPQPAGVEHAAFAIIRKLLDQGRTWVKLSGAYMVPRSGRPAMPISLASHRRTCEQRRSGWSGAAIGHTRRRKRSRTTPCSSVFSQFGRQMKRPVTAFWSRTRKLCMGLRNRS
jgi:predicted TIM-barrel fold metal-dependent hydrolase